MGKDKWFLIKLDIQKLLLTRYTNTLVGNSNDHGVLWLDVSQGVYQTKTMAGWKGIVWLQIWRNNSY